MYMQRAGLAQSVEHLTAEQEVMGLILRTGPILRVLKSLRNEGTAFDLQAARPSRGSDPGGGGVLPNMGYIGMCGPRG